MKPSIIVYGPQACGKTRNAQRIAAHFGLEAIVDNWSLAQPWWRHEGVLYLTNDPLAPNLTSYCVMQYEDVMREIGPAFTDWFPHDVKPLHKGWYPVREHSLSDEEREDRTRIAAHWNGLRWSATIHEGRLGARRYPAGFWRMPWRKYSAYQCWEWRGFAEPKE